MIEPGWQVDSANPAQLRWWDGNAWTGHVAPAPGATGTGGSDCIFISYRRQDTRWPAKLIRNRLTEEFGKDHVFFDMASIPAGYDFTDSIDEYLERTRVMLAVIGPSWLDAQDDAGNRRLDNAKDFVRIELARALERGIRTIPVLVDGADPPPAGLLPPDLAPLALRQAIFIDDKDPDSALDRLVDAVKATPEPQPQYQYQYQYQPTPQPPYQYQPTPAPEPAPEPTPQPPYQYHSTPAPEPPRQPDLTGSRIGAFALDIVLWVALAAGVGVGGYWIRCPEGSEVCKSVGDYDGAVATGWAVGAAVAVLLLLLYWALPVSIAGGTLFMRLFKLKVRRAGGGRVGVWRSFARALLLVIPSLMCGLGVLWLVTLREGRSAVDRWTDTIVVDTRKEAPTPRT